MQASGTVLIDWEGVLLAYNALTSSLIEANLEPLRFSQEVVVRPTSPPSTLWAPPARTSLKKIRLGEDVWLVLGEGPITFSWGKRR